MLVKNRLIRVYRCLSWRNIRKSKPWRLLSGVHLPTSTYRLSITLFRVVSNLRHPLGDRIRNSSTNLHGSASFPDQTLLVSSVWSRTAHSCGRGYRVQGSCPASRRSTSILPEDQDVGLAMVKWKKTNFAEVLPGEPAPALKWLPLDRPTSSRRKNFFSKGGESEAKFENPKFENWNSYFIRSSHPVLALPVAASPCESGSIPLSKLRTGTSGLPTMVQRWRRWWRSRL